MNSNSNSSGKSKLSSSAKEAMHQFKMETAGAPCAALRKLGK